MTIPEQAVALLPCPFCGSDAGISEGDGRFFAHCNSVECFCCIGEAYDRDAMPDHVFYDADTAAAAWNKRAPSFVGVERAASPLRAREEIARAIEQAWDATKPPFNRALVAADAILSRTAGQEWRDISSAPNWKWLPFDAWVVHSEHGGRREADCRINDHNEIIDRGGNNLNWSWQESDGTRTTSKVTSWMPLPAPPVAEPIVAEKSEVKS